MRQKLLNVIQMCGVRPTKMDRIKNGRIRRTTKVGEISKRVQGHVMKRDDKYVG